MGCGGVAGTLRVPLRPGFSRGTPMALPKKEPKGYLNIVSRGAGFAIVSAKQHAGELAALFAQRGIACERRKNVRRGKDELRFSGDTDQAQVQQILDAYTQA